MKIIHFSPFCVTIFILFAPSSGTFTTTNEFELTISNITSDTLNYQNFPSLSVLTVALTMENNTFKGIESWSFYRFRNLKRLTVRNNTLEKIVAGAFHGLGELETLCINDEKNLVTLKSGIFNISAKLRVLDLSDNSLSDLEPGVFNGFRVSEESLFSDIFDGKSHLDLKLNHNLLKIIRRGIFNGLKLRSLSLIGNGLTKIDSNAFNGLDVEVLDLSDNYLEKIEVTTFAGAQIRILYLSRNDIFEIKDSAFSNSPIIILHLDGTNIKKSDDKFKWGLSIISTVRFN